MGSAVGRVLRVTGPLVEVEATGRTAMSDIIEIGPDRLPGEAVRIQDRVVTVQAYEYTGGLRPGAPAVASGRPLAALLGPGLLGGVFDGLLRPLDNAPAWLVPGGPRTRRDRRWRFTPRASPGTPVTPGQLLGTVAGTGPVEYRIMVPPTVAGPLTRLAPAGDHPADAVLAAVGSTELTADIRWPVRLPRPVRERLPTDAPLYTGQRALDLLFPIAKGSTAAVPGGFGTGKTILLQQIAKWSDADVIVYVGCGERGNELAEVVAELFALEDPRTGGRLADRTVIIANTSNMPMMAREASVYTGVTVAEYFRDMGYDVVVIADSTSRWAEALREFAARSGQLPAEEGYPAGLASALAAFYERAGAVVTLGGWRGSVTVVGAVSPPGGDLAEPVTAHTQRCVRCLWTLDRDLAYARHYPAISWSDSFSRDAATVADYHARHGNPDWARRRAQVMAALAEADRLTGLAELVGVGSLPGGERIALLTGRLLREGVLQQSALSAADAWCDAARGAALTDAVLAVAQRCRDAVDAGASAAALEETDFGPLLRARTEAPDATGVARRRDAVLAGLSAAARTTRMTPGTTMTRAAR